MVVPSAWAEESLDALSAALSPALSREAASIPVSTSAGEDASYAGPFVAKSSLVEQAGRSAPHEATATTRHLPFCAGVIDLSHHKRRAAWRATRRRRTG
jgi:hypothetical protein